MTATIRKWGNSLAVRLPKPLAEESNLREGAQVDLVRTQEGLLLKPAAKKRYRLSELVAQITSKNRHAETDWGRAVGQETFK